jgi:small subunit ribosomal protein S13
MPRISGVDIPDHKKVLISLRSVYGIGDSLSQEIINKTKIDPSKRARELTTDEISKIQSILENYATEGELRRLINDNINRLKRIKTYRGSRHMVGLPARGQRTRSNSRTKRTGRRTVGSMTKEMAAKLETAKAKK